MYRWTVRLVVSFALLGFAAPAPAAPGWTPPFPVGAQAQKPVMGPDGTVVFPVITTVEGNPRTAVQVRPPGGPLAPIQAIDQPSHVNPGYPSLAVGGNGRVVAVWIEDGDVQVAAMAPGATTFGPPTALTDDTAVTATVDADASGNATVAWTSTLVDAGSGDTTYRLRATLVPADGGPPTTQVVDE